MSEAARYDRVAVTLHWVIGFALVGQIGFGFMLDTIAPRGTGARAGVINLHKSTGIVIGLAIAVRLAWRLWRGVPPWPAAMGRLQQRLARWGHRSLYGCMALMPLSAYVASNLSLHGVLFFGRRWAPWGPDWPIAYAWLLRVHDATGYLLTALILGHVGIAIAHAMAPGDLGPPRFRIRLIERKTE